MRVICTLPNASARINGVAFAPNPHGPGLVSEDINAALAQRLASIPGYALLDEPAAPGAETETESAAKSRLPRGEKR